MIVKFVNGGTQDTDKLNDLSAQLMEKQMEYVDLMCKHKVPFFAVFIDPITDMINPAAHVMCDEDWARVLVGVNRFVADAGYTLTKKPKTDDSP